MTRFDTLFCLRYAERVLERYSRFWDRADKTIRFFSLLSGSASFAALMTQNKALSLALGISFAVFQALEFALSPSTIAAHAKSNTKLYSDILSRQDGLSDQEMKKAYNQIDDDIVVPESFRKAAYNDVVLEKGSSDVNLYKLSAWHQIISTIS